MKRCYKCKDEKELSEFSINRNKPDNLNSECKECQKKYFKDYYAKNKEKHCKRVIKNIDYKKTVIAKYKKDKGCNRCGYNKHAAALQFHHLNPKEKEFTISYGMGLPLEILLKEIEKCEVLCANCHAIEHFSDKSILKTKIKKTKSRPEKRKKIENTHASRGPINNSKIQTEKRKIDIVKISNIPDDETLKKLLFEVPSEKLAIQFNCSGSYLSRYCKIRNIKKPPRGYWTKRTI